MLVTINSIKEPINIKKISISISISKHERGSVAVVGTLAADITAIELVNKQ